MKDKNKLEELLNKRNQISSMPRIEPDHTESYTEYGVISNSDKKKFVSIVNKLIENGWKCQGGITVVYIAGNLIVEYSQAMVR